MLTDLLRDNFKKSNIKRFVLPTLGEFLYLIASQVKSTYRGQYIKDEEMKYEKVHV